MLWYKKKFLYQNYIAITVPKYSHKAFIFKIYNIKYLEKKSLMGAQTHKKT